MVEVTLQAAENYFNIGVVAIVILLIGLALGILAKKLVYRFLKDLNFNHLGPKIGTTVDLEALVSSLVSYVIYLISIILFLDQLQIRTIAIVLVVAGILLLFLLTFLVGAKNVYRNFKGWLKIRRDPKMRKGRKIEFKEISGIIERARIQETLVRTDKGDILHFPNAIWNKTKK